MQKNLWPEVIKLLSPSTDTCTGSMRTLMRFYVKCLLPYECHVRHDTVSDCLSKVDTSIFMRAVFSKEIGTEDDGRVKDPVVPGRKVNGEAHSDSSGRLNSQTSDSSAGEKSGQEHLLLETRDKEETQPSDNPEDTQTTPVDSYPQEGSDEPLPEISAQETESLLAMPASPTPQAPATVGVPSTPSAEPATPPSFPPPYPPHVPQEWGHHSDMFTGYPSPYSMDVPSYRPPPPVTPMPPGYNPFAPPSQHEIPIDYHLDMPPPMMRNPYDTNPYHMSVAPVMHGSPSSQPNPFFYRAQMMPFTMRSNDVLYPTTPGVNSDWAWQHGSQFPGMMHHHGMQLPPRSNQGLQPSATSRIHLLQQPSHPTSQHQSSTNQSPGPGGETTKQQWQEHSKVKSFDRTVSSSRGKSEYKASSKSEHAQMLDSLKRPLPDWTSSVEGTKPMLAKRKHLLSVDCGELGLKIASAVHTCRDVWRRLVWAFASAEAGILLGAERGEESNCVWDMTN